VTEKVFPIVKFIMLQKIIGKTISKFTPKKFLRSASAGKPY